MTVFIVSQVTNDGGWCFSNIVDVFETVELANKFVRDNSDDLAEDTWFEIDKWDVTES